jgi:nicotinamide riboside kinase
MMPFSPMSEYLQPSFRRMPKVVTVSIIGADSTGQTALAQLLAAHYNTV